MNTEKTLKDELNSFLEITPVQDIEKLKTDEVVITSKTGLVERINKTLITENGKILLTEVFN